MTDLLEPVEPESEGPIQSYCGDCGRPTNTLPCPHCVAEQADHYQGTRRGFARIGATLNIGGQNYDLFECPYCGVAVSAPHSHERWHVDHQPTRFDPHEFATQIMAAILAHAEHSGWYETEDGLHCRDDAVVVIPSSDYLLKHGRWPR